MRNGSAIAIGPIISIVLVLIAAVSFLMIQNHAQGKTLDATELASDAFDNLNFLCNNIDKNGPDAGAKDGDTKSVTFDEFMKSILRVHDKCKNEGKCGLGRNTCEMMTIKLPAGKDCYKLGTAQITEYLGERFNTLSGCTFCGETIQALGWSRIFCKKNPFGYQDDIYSFNKQGDAPPVCDEGTPKGINPYFTIAKNSKVRITSVKNEGLVGIGANVDVELEISEGERSDYDNCEDAPTVSANCVIGDQDQAASDLFCKTHNGEENNDHTYCNMNTHQCVYSGYCIHVCDVVGRGTCPADSGCKKMVLTCTETSCPPKSNSPPPVISSPTLVCEASQISATFNNVVNDAGISFDTSPPPDFLTGISGGNAKYYKKSGNYLVNADMQSSDMQMSLVVGNYDPATREVVVYQGCT